MGIQVIHLLTGVDGKTIAPAVFQYISVLWPLREPSSDGLFTNPSMCFSHHVSMGRNCQSRTQWAISFLLAFNHKTGKKVLMLGSGAGLEGVLMSPGL